jgi:hypothetical protein
VVILALLVSTVIPGFWVLRWRHRHGLVLAKPRP